MRVATGALLRHPASTYAVLDIGQQACIGVAYADLQLPLLIAVTASERNRPLAIDDSSNVGCVNRT